ncbi:MAG: hypothetical protein KBT02_10920 [Treponema sp.]|nr:hypothetical protein [Candidatus Treponema caballi]
MKKLIVLLVMCGLVLFSATAASYTNNTYQKQAREYSRLAQEAFDSGEYDLAVEYAEMAAEYTVLSEAYIRTMVARSDAQKQLNQLQKQLAYAKSIHGDVNYPNYYNLASQIYKASLEAFDAAQYEDVIAWTADALDALKEISAVTALPKYYVVRTWAGDRDCFWNIAGRSYVFGNVWQWKKLYEANKDKLPNPNNPDIIEEGMILEIPSIKGEVREGTYDPKKTYDPIKN